MSRTCDLCFHHCVLNEGQTGLCRARSNQHNQIHCSNYGQITALALDPIEKKPLRHFYPGSLILSAGSYGCNLRCPFCQNAEISMTDGTTVRSAYYSPQALVNRALDLRPQGNIGLAYTYNEPLVGYEYLLDCAALAHQHGLKNVLVSNGTIEEAPFRRLLPLLDALNIDLKGFTVEWYRQLGGDLDTVKGSIRLAAEQCHLEVTTLLIPGANDSEEEIDALSAWLASIDPTIVLHLSRFFPRYRMLEKSPTAIDTVYHLADIARRHLVSVYTGNC